MVSIDTTVASSFVVNELPPVLTTVVAVLELFHPDEPVELELLGLSSAAGSEGGRGHPAYPLVTPPDSSCFRER